MGRFFLLAGLLLSMPAPGSEIALDPEDRRYLAERGPLRFCTDPDWLPLEGVDAQGRHQGMAADFLALMVERGGLRVELVRTRDWSESLRFVRERRCDFLPMAGESPSRLEYLDFTEPYLEIPSVIVTRAQVQHIAHLEQVVDQRLGILRDVSSIESFRARYPHIELVPVESYAQGLYRVQAGELFGMIGNMASLGLALRDVGVGDLKIAGWTGTYSKTGVATRNDEPRLGRVFDRLVGTITPADRREILNRWLVVRFEQGFDYTLLWRVLAAVALVGGLLLAWSISLKRVNRQLAAAYLRVEELSRRDALTGLHNRAYLDEEWSSRLALARRHGLPVALAMIDVDHFKAINDRYGHAIGDAVLKALARLMSMSFHRSGDLVARYGGEEFVVLLIGCTADEAWTLLDALRQRVADGLAAEDADIPAVTISIGLVTATPGPQLAASALLPAADRLLYEAKASGRNRLCAAPFDGASGMGH